MQCSSCGYLVPEPVPAQCPRCGAGLAAADRSGPAWERRTSGLDLQAIYETVKAVLFAPVVTFRRMRREGGLGGPLLFTVILGTVGGWFGILWNSFFQTLGFLAEGFGDEEIFGMVGQLVMAVLMPLIVVAVVFIGAAILHVCLFLVGGAKQGFETTFRVYAYVDGATALFNIFPICGGIVGGIWNVVATIIGIREAHEISTARAALAVLLPLILCCGCIMVILCTVFGAAMTKLFENI